MGLQIQVLEAATRLEIDAAFAVIARERHDAFFVASDTLFSSRRVQLVNLTMRQAIPTAFSNREFAEIGGLMSYGTSLLDAWRQSGSYAGRILKGAKPGDLPMFRPGAKPVRAEAVGRYAIRFDWSDGHMHGIYSWELLRELCPCEECRATRVTT